jgi:hypothetical protein
MGHNNRAFVVDEMWEDNTEWAFLHDTYLGGTLSFDVDLSDVPCQCAAGVFLAHVNDEECSWHAHPADAPPQCDTIAIMEANTFGFLTNHRECSSGTCNEAYVCQSGVSAFDESGTYGPGSYGDYDIDTEMPFNVETQFFVD